MQFSIGHLKSNAQVVIRQYDTEEEHADTKVIDTIEIKEENLQALLIGENIREEDLLNNFSEEIRFYPIMPASRLNLSLAEFETMDGHRALEILLQLRQGWILKNNISLIEEIFKVSNHLTNLWQHDRTSFFEELWFILRSNFGTHQLKIIYNHIQMADGPNKKNKLIRAQVSGDKFPGPFKGEDVEEALMEHYKDEFNSIFSIIEFNEKKGEIVIAAKIMESPILIIAKLYELGKLQETIIKSLFLGLEDKLSS